MGRHGTPHTKRSPSAGKSTEVGVGAVSTLSATSRAGRAPLSAPKQLVALLLLLQLSELSWLPSPACECECCCCCW